MGQRGQSVLVWGATTGTIMVMERQMGHIYKKKTAGMSLMLYNSLEIPHLFSDAVENTEFGWKNIFYIHHCQQTLINQRAEFPRTATEVSEHIVALFREGDLVDSVADEASFQQIAGIFTCFAAIWKPFHMVEKPVDHIRTWEKTNGKKKSRQTI